MCLKSDDHKGKHSSNAKSEDTCKRKNLFRFQSPLRNNNNNNNNNNSNNNNNNNDGRLDQLANPTTHRPKRYIHSIHQQQGVVDLQSQRRFGSHQVRSNVQHRVPHPPVGPVVFRRVVSWVCCRNAVVAFFVATPQMDLRDLEEFSGKHGWMWSYFSFWSWVDLDSEGDKIFT